MPIAPQASNISGSVDSVFLFIFVLSAAFLVLITGSLFYFIIKYNRKRRPRGEDIEGNTWLEIAWTVIPTALFLVMFVYGWTNFSYMREVPRQAMVIQGTGRQWAWSFRYPNGKQTSDLYLAADRPVKMELRSLDVIHGFFIPAFRVKQDAVPGKENYTWFVPTQLGSFDIECTVICGVSHALMLAKAVVIPVDEFERWYAGSDETPLARDKKPTPPANGVMKDPAVTLLTRHLCLSCHSLDGSAMVGPSFKGLYGKKEIIILPDGKEKETIVDDADLEKSIREPAAEIVKGYPPAMPENQLSGDDLKHVLEFIKALR
ncbi:MAG TPA: cytochrome c oxidase subunit II [Acidobacteriota bacterium]|nr:cytochrome c oxidase subunit II [Acidobacteriota bacterium]